jgi:hypothetical protein
MIILNAQIESVATRKDRTIKLCLGTQELEPENAGKLFGLQSSLVSIGIATNELTASEIELLKESKIEIDDIPDSKSPSQRLRGVLYRLWEQSDGGYSDFNLFYLNRMDRIIEHYKAKLDQ